MSKRVLKKLKDIWNILWRKKLVNLAFVVLNGIITGALLPAVIWFPTGVSLFIWIIFIANLFALAGNTWAVYLDLNIERPYA